MAKKGRKRVMMTLYEKQLYMYNARKQNYKNKIEKAMETIKEAIKMNKKMSISCSYGKDSIVLLDLIHKITDNVIVIQSDSGYQLPDTYRIRKYYEDKFKYKTIIIKQFLPFQEFIKRYGMQSINRTRESHEKVVQATKKDRLTKKAKEYGVELTFWGLRKSESKARDKFLINRNIFYNKTKEMWYCSPIAYFTSTDIWTYIFMNNLEYPNFYDMQNCGKTREWIRNTSWVSTDGANHGQLVWLKYNFPEYFEKIRREFKEIGGYV